MDSAFVLAALILGFNISQEHVKSSTTSLGFVEQHLYTQACLKLGESEAQVFLQIMICPIVHLAEASLHGYSLPVCQEEKNLKLKILLQDAQELRLLMLAEHSNPIHVVKTSGRFRPSWLLREIDKQWSSAAKMSELKRDQLDRQWQQVLTHFKVAHEHVT